jgi:hypothetical protein
MKNRKIQKPVLSLVLLSIIGILTIVQNTSYGFAEIQYDNETLTLDSQFLINEYSEDFGTHHNVDSINLGLPSSSWIMNDLELNFTNIKLGKEIKSIEEGGSTFMELSWDENLAYGVQINITEPTILFGVMINGFIQLNEEKQPTVDVLVQIRGNTAENTPNETVYISEMINIDESLKWYPQVFSSPITLNTGLYYFVINGSNLTELDKTKYYWFNNENIGTHIYPNLHTAEYDGSSWNDMGIENVFRHKLIQRVNRAYNPEDINMTIEFDGTNYAVISGTEPYQGYIELSNQNFSPEKDFLHLPIENNQSIELLVNFTYHLKQRSSFLSKASVVVKEDSENLWSLTPEINRTTGIYSIDFTFPENWYSFSIYRNDLNISLDPNINILNKKLTIFNNAIIDGSTWNITALSPNIAISYDIPLSEYNSSQTIKVSAEVNKSGGTFTFILIDPYGLEDYRESIENTEDNLLFTHQVPLNPFEGKWKIFIIWNDDTDAGMKVMDIQINNISEDNDVSPITTGIDPKYIIWSILIFTISSLVSGTGFQITKRYKRKKEERRLKIFNKYMDILNLEYIIITEKNSGINIYEQVLTGKNIDASLISGFLQAIQTFGIELSDSNEQSQTIKLEYQDSIILMSEFKGFRIISIMKEHPSQDFISSLKDLSYEIHENYGELLEKFDGEVKKFAGIKEIIEENFNTSLIYPLRIIINSDVNLDATEKEMVFKALKLMKERRIKHFYVSYLTGENEFIIKNAEVILRLIKKKVFRPINE